jgi:hypothetical protein
MLYGFSSKSRYKLAASITKLTDILSTLTKVNVSSSIPFIYLLSFVNLELIKLHCDAYDDCYVTALNNRNINCWVTNQ